MSAHPACRATRAIRAETAGSSGLALGPNQRGKGGGEVEASIPVMATAHQRTRALAGEQTAHGIRHEDLARAGFGGDAGGQDHCCAEETTVFFDGLTSV